MPSADADREIASERSARTRGGSRDLLAPPVASESPTSGGRLRPDPTREPYDPEESVHGGRRRSRKDEPRPALRPVDLRRQISKHGRSQDRPQDRLRRRNRGQPAALGPRWPWRRHRHLAQLRSGGARNPLRRGRHAARDSRTGLRAEGDRAGRGRRGARAAGHEQDRLDRPVGLGADRRGEAGGGALPPRPHQRQDRTRRGGRVLLAGEGHAWSGPLMTRSDGLPIGSVDAFGLTDAGRVRKTNQDHFVIASLGNAVRIRRTSLPPAALSDRLGTSEAMLFAVADGVGGRPGGEEASSATVGGLVEDIARATGGYSSLGVEEEHELLERLERGIQQAHEAIRRRHAGAEQMPATTLTMALFVAPRAYIVHVGDTRAYYLRKGSLRQITRDQTVGEALVDMGAMHERQAAQTSAMRALASAIGAEDLTPSIGLIDLEPADTLLLCSDGLTKHVPDNKLAEVLARPLSAEAACGELIALALAGGG